ncbi:hypothetical protein PO124_11250 [Bacillus licheniformis]|nr:hypothetical protein [Bacillus licheniformis]
MILLKGRRHIGHSCRKDDWSHVSFHSYYVDLNSGTLIADVQFEFTQTMTVHQKPSTKRNKRRQVLRQMDQDGNVIDEATTGDMSICGNTRNRAAPYGKRLYSKAFFWSYI